MYNVLLVFKTKKECESTVEMEAWEKFDCFNIVFRTKSIPDALEFLIHNPVSLVLCDVSISDMGGITLLKDIKKKNMADAVILFASRADAQAARQSLAYGAFDYVIKPVEESRFEDILQRVKCYLDDKRSSREHIDNLVRIVLDKVGHYYPKAQIAQIVTHIGIGYAETSDEAISMLNQTRRALDDDFYKVSFIISRSIHEIISKVFSQNSWLNQFLSKQELLELSAAEYKDFDSLAAMVVQITDTLCGCMRNLALKHIENPTIQRLADYVTVNLDKELSLESLAEKLYISKTYLSELFKSKTGCAITEYLTRVKMEKARNIFMEKHLKTKEVASMLGYKDFVYFSKIYKKYWGTTPGQLNKI